MAATTPKPQVCSSHPSSSSEDRAGLELAAIFRGHFDQLSKLPPHQVKAAHAIMNCRTAVLGGHVDECDQCQYSQISYNSCRNRSCPKCQALTQARWLEARMAELLPVPYFHIVFTIPEQLHPFFRQQPRQTFNNLFRAVAETLKEVAANPENIGGRIGFTAVLHTWTQKLLFHPHVHCVVPGGALSFDGKRWIATSPRFFVHVGKLSKVFRGKLLSKLERMVNEGTLTFEAARAARLLRQAARRKWNVFSKRPFAGPQQVLAYLGRYTHRIAISNHRLISLDDTKVTFRYRDRKDESRTKTLSVDAVEFLRRFLQHVPLPGFMRIRHYGLLANSGKAKYLARCRALLEADSSTVDTSRPDRNNTEQVEDWQQLIRRLTGRDPTQCPVCGKGKLIRSGLPVPSRPRGQPSRARSP